MSRDYMILTPNNRVSKPVLSYTIASAGVKKKVAYLPTGVKGNLTRFSEDPAPCMCASRRSKLIAVCSEASAQKVERPHPPTYFQAAGEAPLPPYLRQLCFPRRI